MKRLLIAIVYFLTIYSPANAEVSIPYIIDEKTRVMFADTSKIVATSTYQGLENYTHEYVNGFLSISFTYTHAGCCSASYPPSLYITSANPTSTTTYSTHGIYPVYQLHTQPTHLSGLYKYNVQFDKDGYQVIVVKDDELEIANIRNDLGDINQYEWVSLVNNYPRQEPINDYSMSFTPLSVKISIQDTIGTSTPVVVIPGISSSYLIKDNNPNLEAWINIPQMLVSINDSYLDDLILPNSFLITAKSIIRQTGNNDFYSGFFNALKIVGLQEDEDVFEFPYDWRLSVANSSVFLKKRIDEIKATKGISKVDLVAHSMGGLVVKKYLKDYGGDSVNKFIDIATPHTGAPKAFKILNYGDDFGASFLFGLVGLNSDRVKYISQNMPSIYELLPSIKYFDDNDANYKYYVANLAGGAKKYDFNGTKSFLNSSGRNSLLVGRAEEFHHEIDDLNPADYGAETYNIVGCGTPTIGQFYIIDDSASHPIYNIKMIDGDGTVPRRSAESLAASTTYYLKYATHALMPSTLGVKNLVASLLVASGTPVDISSYANLSLNSSGCSIPNGKLVSFHSPINLHVYDQSGNHSGPNTEGELENNIPGVVYETIEDNKFAFLPDGVEYEIKGDATGIGSFDVRIQEISNGDVATTTIFKSIPLTNSTHAKFALGVSVPVIISIDSNGDGIYEGDSSYTIRSAGLIEGSGAVIESTKEPEGRSRSNRIMATSTTEVLALPVASSTTRIAIVEKKVSISLNKTLKQATVTPSENKEVFKNTAVAYKSTGSKINNLMSKFWWWIKKKF